MVLTTCTPTATDRFQANAEVPRHPTFVNIQTEILEIDSLCEIHNFSGVEARLAQLLETENEWRKQLTPGEYAWVYDWIGEFHLRLGNLPEAKRYIEMAFTRFDSIQDIDFKAHLLNNRAVIESDLGNYDSALQFLFQGMDLYDSDTDHEAFIDFYNNIGTVYTESKQYDLAITYYEKLMALASTLGMEDEYGFYHANIGQTYLKMGDTQKGMAHLEEARVHFIKHNKIDEELQLNTLLASNYILAGDLERAEKLLQGNLEEAAEKKLWAVYVETTISLFEFYVARGEVQTAFELIGQGLDKIHITQTARLQMKIYDRLSDYYRQTGDFENAFAYMKRHQRMQDSIQDAMRTDFMQELTVRYETDRKNDRIAQLQLLHESEQFNKRLYLSGLLLAIGILVCIFLLLRRISIQKRALEEANRTKDKFFSIIAHDLRSPMIALQGMGDLMNYYIEKNELYKLAELGNKTGQALGRINHLLDNLLNWAVSNSGQLAFRPVEKEIAELLEDVSAVHRTAAEAKEIQWETDVQPARIFVDLNMAFSILHNVLSNAVKHAPRESSIRITGRIEKSFYKLGIEDEGGGMPQEVLERLARPGESLVAQEAGKGSFGLGLRLVRSFVERHMGRLQIQNIGSGTLVEISLPLRQGGFNPAIPRLDKIKSK